MPLRIGITGATGYIGQAAAAFAWQAGHEVISIGRHALPGACEHRPADISHPPPEGLLDALDAVLHLAADTAGDGVPATSEIRFAVALAQQAAERHVPLLVMSSQAASTQAPSAYGRTKAAIEAAVLPHGAMVMRPGQVYGGAGRGLYGQLLALVRRMPMIPALRPQPLVQPVHVDDLAAAMLATVVQAPMPGRVWRIAGPQIRFDDFLAAMARYRLRIARRRLPVPLPLLRIVLVLAGRLLGPRFSPERLDSLTRLPVMDAEADLQALGITLRPLADGLGPRGRPERRLLQEGCALMHGVLGSPPYRFALRRYVQAMRASGIGHALPLPERMIDHPALVAALDAVAFRRNASRGDLAWRYNVATRIVEAQRQHAGAFIGDAQHGGLLRMMRDGLQMTLRELQARLLAPWARRMLARLP